MDPDHGPSFDDEVQGNSPLNWNMSPAILFNLTEENSNARPSSRRPFQSNDPLRAKLPNPITMRKSNHRGRPSTVNSAGAVGTSNALCVSSSPIRGRSCHSRLSTEYLDIITQMTRLMKNFKITTQGTSETEAGLTLTTMDFDHNPSPDDEMQLNGSVKMLRQANFPATDLHQRNSRLYWNVDPTMLFNIIHNSHLAFLGGFMNSTGAAGTSNAQCVPIYRGRSYRGGLSTDNRQMTRLLESVKFSAQGTSETEAGLTLMTMDPDRYPSPDDEMQGFQCTSSGDQGQLNGSLEMPRPVNAAATDEYAGVTTNDMQQSAPPVVRSCRLNWNIDPAILFNLMGENGNARPGSRRSFQSNDRLRGKYPNPITMRKASHRGRQAYLGGNGNSGAGFVHSTGAAGTSNALCVRSSPIYRGRSYRGRMRLSAEYRHLVNQMTRSLQNTTITSQASNLYAALRDLPRDEVFENNFGPPEAFRSGAIPLPMGEFPPNSDIVPEL